jgi:hypothetical protein
VDVGIALFFLDLGARRGWVVNTTPQPLYPRERPGTHCTGNMPQLFKTKIRNFNSLQITEQFAKSPSFLSYIIIPSSTLSFTFYQQLKTPHENTDEAR